MMRKPSRSTRQGRTRSAATGLLAVAGLLLAFLLPAQAQFWSPFGPFGGAPRRPPAPVQQQPGPQQYNPFGGWFGPPPEQQRPAAPADNSHAPAAQARRADQPAPTTSIVVMGDAMADWLAYGLEDAFTERPEIGVVRKGRIGSGLIRYDPKRDVDWAQTAREIITAEKPKFIVMMIGINDHQQIRERAPAPRTTPNSGGKPGAAPAPSQTAESAPAPTEDLPDAESPDQTAADSGRSANPTGPFEFHTDLWEAAYIKRIDATIAALKSAGVPVLWVGLPAQRGPKATQDASYLNELYRSRAEKAGIVYVDIWDGFVDEQGRYSAQGPDFEGQIRRLRSADGIYFTKAGARKLAHYVEREIDRAEANRFPVALPLSVEPTPAIGKPGGSSRPLVGPVVPLTVSATPAGSGAEELLGGARPAPRPATTDPLATRVLIKGEAVTPPTGRADDFNWPRENAATVTAEPISPSPPAAASTAPGAANPTASGGTAPARSAKPLAANAPGGNTYQRLDPNNLPDDSKPKPPRKPALAPAPSPSPFATIPNIFR